MRRISIFACLLILSGCQSSLSQLKTIDPQAEDFTGSLAAEYLAYSMSEAEQGRAESAERYAAKGLRAYYGETVDPEPLDASLPAAMQEQLAIGREALIAVSTPDMKQAAPQKLARAQLLFDCWQQQQKSHMSSERAPCADEFQSTIGELEEAAETFGYSDETTYRLTFEPGSAELNDETLDALDEITRMLSAASGYSIELEHHAPSALGEKRMTAVRQALSDAAVPAARIRIRESGKAVLLGGERRPRNTLDIHVTVYKPGVGQ